MNLGGRLHLELTAESFNLFKRDNKNYEVSARGYYNLAGQPIKYTQYPVTGGGPLSGVLSTTYKFNKSDERVCSAADATFDAVRFLRWSEDSCTFHLT